MTVPRVFDLGFWILSFFLFVFVFIRAWLVPFAHDEVATFYFYIQPGSFIPFKAHPDANGHFLTSALGWICFKILGSSPLSLRLPSVAAFALLCYAVFRFRSLFTSKQVRFFFTGSFLLVFTFLAYFSLCRGYGISMACLLMSLFYFFSYQRHSLDRHFFKFLVFAQLALAANLTLLFVVGLCSLFCVAVQFKRRRLFRISILFAWTLHVALLVFWALFAFFLKEQGALYYGAGESYWIVTFRSLIDNLFSSYLVLEVFFLFLFILLGIIFVLSVVRHRSLFTEFSTAFILFTLLVFTFFLLKHTIGVNYPEDRTGLFFYVFFVCALAFFLDEARFPRWILVIPLIAVFVFTAARRIDLVNHPWAIYETMPPSFFDKLVAEQSQQEERITIAGHRVREFIYGFSNYRSPVKLNHMTSPDALQMNCDYALAAGAEKPWYDKYYEEIDREDRWGFRLLKRKLPLTREPVLSGDSALLFEGDHEYFNCFELRDTIFPEGLPLQADVTFEVLEAPVPLHAWFVVQAEGANEDENVFVRVPLDLIHHHWTNAGTTTLSLVTPNMPKTVKRLVFYLWNINKEPLKVRINNYRLRRLEGEGVTVISQANL